MSATITLTILEIDRIIGLWLACHANYSNMNEEDQKLYEKFRAYKNALEKLISMT